MTPTAPILLVALLAVACSDSLSAQRGRLVHQPPKVTEVDPPAIKLVPAFGELQFERPVDAVQAPGDDAWYIVEQHGVIRRVRAAEGAAEAAAGGAAGGFSNEVWLDIHERVSRAGNEEGLLGLAFSPFFATSGHPHEGAFYVDYSMKDPRRSRLSRFRLAPGADAVDQASEEVLFEVAQPYDNHNGGGLMFGPDGMLYYSLGDGGAGGDPQGNSQDITEPLGSILRFDVAPRDDGKPYGVPADNPLVGRPGPCPEIWAYGLRNVWRFSFDSKTGEMWAGDVGQDEYEFIFVVQKGGNHGWDLLEGFHGFELPVGEQPPEPLVAPVFEYPHPDGFSITGGYVYRGSKIPALVGWYVFGDYASERLWAIRRTGEHTLDHTTLSLNSVIMSSFAQERDGELLLVEHLGERRIWRLVPGDG